MRRHDLELRVVAVAGRLVRAPAPEVRDVTEALALHVVVGDLGDELRSQRLPGEGLAAAPAALRPRHPLWRRVRRGVLPILPGMIRESVHAAGRERPTSSRGLASLKLAATPTCWSDPASS